MNALAISTNEARISGLSNELQPAAFEAFVSYIGRDAKTTRSYITNLKQFAAWLRYEGITAPVREDIISYRNYLTSEHDAIELNPESVTGWSYRTDSTGNRFSISCKPNTTAQYLRNVCQLFKWTASQQPGSPYYYPNIAENIHAPKISAAAGHKKEALSATDVRTIERSILTGNSERAENAAQIERTTEQGKRLYAMYLLAVNAGLRTIEISRANIKDLETKNGIASLYIWGKGHTEADTKKAIAPEVYEAIQEYLESRADRYTGTSPLFVSTGNRSGGKRIAPTTISTMLKRAMQAAGYNSEKLTAHSLRHTAAQNVLQITGKNVYKAQKYLRHSSPVTTEIYLRESEEETQEQAELAEQLFQHYQGNETTESKRQQLESLIAGMSEAQLEQMIGIAAAIVK